MSSGGEEVSMNVKEVVKEFTQQAKETLPLIYQMCDKLDSGNMGVGRLAPGSPLWARSWTTWTRAIHCPKSAISI